MPPLFSPNNYAGDTENLFGNIVSINLLCVRRRARPPGAWAPGGHGAGLTRVRRSD
jgi:hypothetical protein